MDHKTVIVVQSRMASTRFPGKALASLLGQPMLLMLLDRLSRVRTPHDLVVACPNTPEDQAIQDLCATHGYQCLLIPGDPNDVLGRFYAVAEIYDAQEIVRITGDCPFLDAEIVEGVIACRRDNHVEHAGIAAEYGDGLDCEAFTREALDRAINHATSSSDREHVTPWMHRHCACATYPCPFDLRWLRLSVDTPEDLALVEAVLVRGIVTGYGLDVPWRDLLALCSHNQIREQMARRPINQAYVEQVAAERGERQDWYTLRYGKW